MVLTNAQRQARLRQRMKEAGFKAVVVWILPEHEDQLKKIEKKFRRPKK